MYPMSPPRSQKRRIAPCWRQDINRI